ncbi:hypothetical protein F4604DRAFT_1941068 [Suillus subluteus]|nr:hypothetical protein F4604DRAFT_1941068 [Suillus subluteus]
MQFLLVSYEIEREDFPRLVEEENHLPPNAIASICWIKPPQQRSKVQCTAFALLQVRDVNTANHILKEGICIDAHRYAVNKDKKEPLHCAKCQKFSHMARNCSSPHDICGTCSRRHWTTQCKSFHTECCVNCKSQTHTSWSRKCPEFIHRCKALDDAYPENKMPFFPADSSWTPATHPPRPSTPHATPHPTPTPTPSHSTAPDTPTPPLHPPNNPPLTSSLLLKPKLDSHHLIPLSHPPPPQHHQHPQPPLTPLHPRPLPTRLPAQTLNCPPLMSERPIINPVNLKIWQQNLNASLVAQESLMNSPDIIKRDLLIIQEPHINFLHNTRASHRWHVLYLTHHLSHPQSHSRAITFINTALNTNTWRQIPFPSSNVVIVQLSGEFGTCTILNIYNNCTHQNTLTALDTYLDQNIAALRPTADDHMLWLGDFN